MPSTTANDVFNAAVAAHKAGDLEAAERDYHLVARALPREAEPQYLLGAVLTQLDRPNEAIKPLQHCLKLKPDHTPALSALGAALSKTGKHLDAVTAFRKAEKNSPDDIKIKLNLGRACIAAEQFDIGEKALKAVLDNDAMHEEALQMHATCIAKLGREQDAIAALLEGLSRGLKTATHYDCLIKRLNDAKKYEEAFCYAQEAISLWPDNNTVLLGYAISASLLKKEATAQEAFEILISREPRNHGFLNKFGTHLYEAGQWKEAEEYVKRALDIEPNSIGAITNLGRIRQQRGDLDGAHTLYKKATQIAPEYADAYNNLGNLSLYMDDIDSSLEHFETALSLKPNSSDLLFNKSVALMNKGLIKEAWQGQTERFKKANPPPRREWDWPAWHGEDMDGKRILLWSEQGIGDQIIHARCAPLIADKTELCVLECDRRLQSLFSRSFQDLQVFGAETPPEEALTKGPFDFQGSILDVNCFQYQTPADICPTPYLKADQELTKSLRDKYHSYAGKKPLVGISWWSGWTFHAHFKSTELKQWKNILDNPDVTFVSLQYGDRSEEISEFEAETGIQVLEDMAIEHMGDLDPVAAQVAAMDMVITISNTTAHLAGGLGIPVLNMTSTGPGRLWYWFTEGDRSPWYDSMRLYRHAYNEGWDNVLRDVAEEFRKRTLSLKTKIPPG